MQMYLLFLLTGQTAVDPFVALTFSLYLTNARIATYIGSTEGLYHRHLACVALCARQHMCLGINWNDEHGRCELFNVVVSAEIAITTAGWMIYIK
jgi:hypothetical protein